MQRERQREQPDAEHRPTPEVAPQLARDAGIDLRALQELNAFSGAEVPPAGDVAQASADLLQRADQRARLAQEIEAEEIRVELEAPREPAEREKPHEHDPEDRRAGPQRIVGEHLLRDPVRAQEESQHPGDEDRDVTPERMPHLVREDGGQLLRRHLRQERVAEEHDAAPRRHAHDRGVGEQVAGPPHIEFRLLEARESGDGQQELLLRTFRQRRRLPRRAQQERQQESER